MSCVVHFFFAVPVLLSHFVLKPQNLQKRYNCEWALVTGASSGIGRSIATKLAEQGFNLFLLAQDETTLSTVQRDLKSRFPSQAFRSHQIDFSSNEMTSQMAAITQLTAAHDIRIVCLIAGVLHMQAFELQSSEQILSDIKCNINGSVEMAHYFYSRIAASKRGGCLVFMSSSTAFCPSPFAATYAATKAFFEAFVSSLSIEARDHKIDVLSLSPGYVATDLFRYTPNNSLLRLLALIGQTPNTIADIALASIGNFTQIDCGLFAVLGRLANRVLGCDVLARVIAFLVKFVFADVTRSMKVNKTN
eukprot:c5469_g1_i1.p1 GENE.c5469_g1_i1~~c5469_g1_i1.p1  ORF type:complete len:305 (+),score=78.27 c5469_g1_i1:74-988(+)